MAFDWITREHENKNHEFIEISLKNGIIVKINPKFAGSNYFMGFCIA